MNRQSKSRSLEVVGAGKANREPGGEIKLESLPEEMESLNIRRGGGCWVMTYPAPS